MRLARILSFTLMAALCLVAQAAAAEDLLVSSRFANRIFRYDASGVPLGVFASCNNPNGMAWGPDGNLYVALGDEPRVIKLDRSGALLAEFVGPATPGGLANPRGLAFGPDGNLYVCSGGSNQVLEYAGDTGAFLRVAATGQGMQGPVGLAFGADGTLFVGCALSNRLYTFAPDGTFVRSSVCGTARTHVGVAVDHAGRVLVAQSVTNQVVAYDAVNGQCLAVVAQGNGLSAPIYLTIETDGNLLVGSFANDSVLRFDPASGQFLGVVVASGAGGLDGTHTALPVPDVATGARRLGWGTLKVLYR